MNFTAHLLLFYPTITYYYMKKFEYFEKLTINILTD